MKPLAQPNDDALGMLQARLRFWLTVPSATAMHARLEAEIAERKTGQTGELGAVAKAQPKRVASPIKSPKEARSA